MRPLPLVLSVIALSITLITLLIQGIQSSSPEQNLIAPFARPRLGCNLPRSCDLRNPANIAALEPFTCFRLSDEGLTPSNPEQDFGPLFDLCARLSADVWICVPSSANDDYVESLALLAKNRLSPTHVLHIEYSDRTCLLPHSQAQLAGYPAGARCSDPEKLITQTRSTARRSSQIFAIFERVMGSRQHIVRVLNASTPAQELLVTQALLDEAQGNVDAILLPIAMHIDLPPDITPETLPAYLDSIESDCMERARILDQRQQKLASEYNVRLLALSVGIQFSMPTPSDHVPTPNPLLALAAQQGATLRISGAMHKAWLNDLMIIQTPLQIVFQTPSSASDPLTPAPGTAPQ